MAPGDRLTINLLAEAMHPQKQSPQFKALLKDAAAKNPTSTVLQDALGTQR